MTTETEQSEVVAELSYKVFADGKAALQVTNLQLQDVVFICEKTKMDAMSGKLN